MKKVFQYAGIVLFAGAFVCIPHSAGAQTVDSEDRFNLMDANHDNSLSWEEFSAVNSNISRKGFDTIDSDKNTLISRDEWRAFSSNHGGDMVMSGKMTTMPARDAIAPTAPAAPQMPLILPPNAPTSAKPVVEPVQNPNAPAVSAPTAPTADAPKQVLPPLVTPPPAPKAPEQTSSVTPPQAPNPAQVQPQGSSQAPQDK